MKKIVAEVMSLSNKSLYPRIYCVSDDGQEDQAVSLTLCDTVWELNGEPIRELERIAKNALEGRYVPDDINLPDFSINDKFIWIRPPFALVGQVCISNENVPELSVDTGAPQSFTMSQFKVVADLASSFLAEITHQGRERLVGCKFEVDFPER